MLTNDTSSTSTNNHDFVFRYPRYMLRRKMLKLIGGRVDIYNPQELPVMCCLQKAFKLKEDITLYADDSKKLALLNIKARNIIDFSAAYDVFDSQTSQRIGVLRRKGFRSMLRDSWEVLDSREIPVGTVEEDNMMLALVRRLLTDLIPQSFNFTARNGNVVAEARQRFNPFIHRMDIFMPTGNQVNEIDPRLIIAGSLLLVLIEGRQN